MPKRDRPLRGSPRARPTDGGAASRLAVGARLELEVHGLGARGEGLATHEGLELRVPGAFPGERVRARLDARSQHHARAFATLLEVLTPHPARRDAPCPRHASRPGGACTGCPLMQLSPAAQREAKRARVAGLGLPDPGELHHGAAVGYRMSAKRVVGRRGRTVVLGSYVEGTHRLADMRGCHVDHPRIRAAADEVARVASELGIAPYDAERSQGDLRYVWLRTDGEGVLVTLVTAAHETRAHELAAGLTLPVGVAHAVQAGSGSAARGVDVTTLVGVTHLRAMLAGREATVGPLGFLQPNPELASRGYAALLTDEAGGTLEGGLALDLYAGAGVTTALLRERFREVLPVESYPESAAALGVAPADVASFLAAFDRARELDLVVANPPRAGLGEAVCAALVRLAAPRLHVMSCSADTMAADLAALAATYDVRSVLAFDTLPETAHVELVVRLARR